MEKRNYVKPLLNSEEFVPQTYVAACYSISCNVPWGIGYLETIGITGYQETKKQGCNCSNKNHTKKRDCSTWSDTAVTGDTFLAEGYGCQTKHTASGVAAEGPSANAMWDPSYGEPYEVFHWIMNSGSASSHHFSKVSDAQWEQNPNAS